MTKNRISPRRRLRFVRYFIAMIPIVIILFLIISIFLSLHDIHKTDCSRKLIVKNEQKRFEIPNKLDDSSFFISIDTWKDMAIGSTTEKFGYNYRYCNASAIAYLSIYEQQSSKIIPRLVGNLEVNAEFLVERNYQAIYDFDETFRRYANSFNIYRTGEKARLAQYYYPSDEFFGGSVLLVSINGIDTSGMVLDIIKDKFGTFILSTEADPPTNQ